MQQPFVTTRFSATLSLAVVATIWHVCSQTATAGGSSVHDLVTVLPANAAIVILVPDPAALSERATALIRSIRPDANRIDVVQMIESRGLPSGCVDVSAPVALVFRSVESMDRPIVVFRPTVTSLAASEGTEPLATARHGEWLAAGRGSKAVEAAIRPGRRSLGADLSVQEVALLDASDAVIRIPMKPWRAKIQQWLVVARLLGTGSNLVGERTVEKEVETAALTWLLDGITECVAQINSTMLSLSLAHAGVRLRHHHAFTDSGKVADYLRDVHRTDADMWAGLPRRPFSLALASTWQNPRDDAIMQDLFERVTRSPTIRAASSQPSLESLARDTGAFYRLSRGSTFVCDFSPCGAMQAWGTLIVEDSAKAFDLLGRMAGNADATLGTFMPTWSTQEMVQIVEREGLRIREAPLTTRSGDSRNARIAERMYGDARYRMAAISKDVVAYTITHDEADLLAMSARLKAGKAEFRETPAIAATLQQAPRDAVLLAIADVGRLADALPALAALEYQAEAGGGTAPPSPEPVAPREDAGPLALWSLTTAPTWIQGELFMTQSDVARCVEPLAQMAARLESTQAATQPAATFGKRRVRVQVDVGERSQRREDSGRTRPD